MLSGFNDASWMHLETRLNGGMLLLHVQDTSEQRWDKANITWVNLMACDPLINYSFPSKYTICCISTCFWDGCRPSCCTLQQVTWFISRDLPSRWFIHSVMVHHFIHEATLLRQPDILRHILCVNQASLVIKFSGIKCSLYKVICNLRISPDSATFICFENSRLAETLKE